MPSNDLLNILLEKGLEELINEKQRIFIANLRKDILALIESKQDEKVIIKKIIDLLDDKYNHSIFDPRGW